MSAMSEYYKMRGIRRGQEEFDDVAEAAAIKRKQDLEYNEEAQPVRIQGIQNKGKRQGREEELQTATQPNLMRGVRMEGEEQIHADEMAGIERPVAVADAQSNV